MKVNVGDTVRCRCFVNGKFIGEDWIGQVLGVCTRYKTLGTVTGTQLDSIPNLIFLIIQALIPDWLSVKYYEVSRLGSANMICAKKEILEVLDKA